MPINEINCKIRSSLGKFRESAMFSAVQVRLKQSTIEKERLELAD